MCVHTINEFTLENKAGLFLSLYYKQHNYLKQKHLYEKTNSQLNFKTFSTLVQTKKQETVLWSDNSEGKRHFVP